MAILQSSNGVKAREGAEDPELDDRRPEGARRYGKPLAIAAAAAGAVVVAALVWRRRRGRTLAARWRRAVGS
jgi:hypothetical protein